MRTRIVGIAAVCLAAGVLWAGSASASTLDGPPGYGYIATFTSPIECVDYGNAHQASAHWVDFVCAQTNTPAGPRWELYAK
jgi:hypothetical protein